MKEPEHRGEQEAQDVLVLRQPQQSLGTRRLPGMQGATAAAATPETQSHTLDSLRSTFAAELVLLEEEARQKGLADAHQTLSKARAEQQEEQARQWQKKESALRLALEEEQQRLATLAKTLAEKSQQAIDAMEPVVGRLALLAVMRVLGQHMVSRPLVVDMANQAIDQYRLSQPLHIRVSAADYASVQAAVGEERSLACFQVDHDVAVGSCMIDFGAGQLDASLETQLAVIRQALLGDEQGDGCVARA